jgi:hypothetical protein
VITPEVTAEPTPTPEVTAEPTPTPEVTAEPTRTPEATTGPVVTPAPTVGPTPQPSAAPAFWPQYLRDPGSDNSLGNLGAVGGSALLALLIAFLIPFPGTLFNKTVEANYGEIQGWFASLRERWRGFLARVAVGPLRPPTVWLGTAMTGPTGVWLFLLLSALVYGFLSPSFGLNFNSLILFLGLVVGLAFITAAFDLPLRVYHRRRTLKQDAGVLRALWWTLGIAIICVLVSRLADFQPGYLYGLIISIVFVTEIGLREEGLGTWLASLWLLALSFIAWLLLGIVRTQGGDATLQLFIQTILATFVVAGIEALVIGLLPMRFLPGHPLFAWRRSLWFPVFALAIFGYLLILVDPANGYLSADSKAPIVVGIVFLVGFGMVSLGTWAYFRYRPARTDGDRPGEAPELPGEHSG